MRGVWESELLSRGPFSAERISLFRRSARSDGAWETGVRTSCELGWGEKREEGGRRAGEDA